MSLWQPHSVLDHAVTMGIVVPHILKRVGPFQGLVALLKLMFWFGMLLSMQLQL